MNSLWKMNLMFSRIAKDFVSEKSWLKVCGPYNHGCAPKTPGVVLGAMYAWLTPVGKPVLGSKLIYLGLMVRAYGAPGTRCTFEVCRSDRVTPLRFMPPSPYTSPTG